jgi:uncharacterized protein (TIGR01777 family)
MRILITGGTGLVGQALSENLLTDGHEVIVLSRRPEQARDIPQGVQLHRWDAETAEGWRDLVNGCKAVVNLAGASLAGDGFFPTRWNPERKHLIEESRIRVGRAVVQAISQADKKPEVVVQASTVGFYGFHESKMFTEESERGDDWGARFTAEIWEPSTFAVESMGVRRISIRSGIVLSKKGGALTRLLLPFRLFVGGPMGSGRQWYSWIHVLDHVRAIRFLIESTSAVGAFNLTAPHPVTNGEIAKNIGKTMKRPSFIPVPGFALKLVFGEVADVVLKGQRVIPERLIDLGFQFKYPTIEKALQDLLD